MFTTFPRIQLTASIRVREHALEKVAGNPPDFDYAIRNGEVRLSQVGKTPNGCLLGISRSGLVHAALLNAKV
jgi:hypothetical protein